MSAILFVGIDVSKLKHDVVIVNELKQLVHKPVVIPENAAGYQNLLAILNRFRQTHNTTSFYIGLEATGEYWKNLYYFLKNQSSDFFVTVINPFQTKKFAEGELRRAKTDLVNAKDIALFMLEKRPLPSHDRAPIFDLIKDLDRQMLHFTKQQTMAKNKLRLELTKVAPEIEQTIDNLGGPQILAWLQHFPTAHDMAKASTQRLQDVRYGTRGRALPSTYIKKMQALAQNSIAYKNGPTAGLIVLALVRHIRHLQQEIQQIKQHIRKLYLEIQDHDSLLTTITGIGKETAIVLEAYIGDVNRFPNAKKIVAYFGMNPVVNLSGKVTKRNSYLEKKGSGRVRHKLFMAVLHIIQMREGPIYAFYKRLVAAGKPKLVALIAAMRKLLVIIYAMLKTQQPFDANHT